MFMSVYAAPNTAPLRENNILYLSRKSQKAMESSKRDQSMEMCFIDFSCRLDNLKSVTILFSSKTISFLGVLV